MLDDHESSVWTPPLLTLVDETRPIYEEVMTIND